MAWLIGRTQTKGTADYALAQVCVISIGGVLPPAVTTMTGGARP